MRKVKKSFVKLSKVCKTYESVDLNCSTSGIKSVVTAQTFVAGTIYWIGVYNSITMPYNAFVSTSLIPIMLSGSFPVTHLQSATTFGSAPTTFGSSLPTGGNAPIIGITI